MSRRHVLGTLGVAATGLAGISGTAGAAEHEETSYLVSQGGRCVPVVPLSGTQPVEELYDLRIPPRYTGDNGSTGAGAPYFRSVGTADLQAPLTSITFLYDGPDGLSLVVVHGMLDDTEGGAASWTVSGLPDSGSWVVKDDRYLRLDTGEPAGSNYDQWDLGGEPHVIDWTWAAVATDGGAFTALGGDFEVTITPRYNEAATLWNQYYEGRLDHWQFLSGDRSTPDRIDLAMDQPLTITTGACGPSTIEVDIDVMPGSSRNPINPRSRGVVPVLVRGSDTFDPWTIDVSTLRFGPTGAVERGGASPAHDEHDEGDLVVHFPVEDAGFSAGDTRAKLVGTTGDGHTIYGFDDVSIVGDDEAEELEEERKERENEREEERKEREKEREEERKEREEERKEREKEREEERKEQEKERDEERKEREEERKEREKERDEERKELEEERKEREKEREEERKEREKERKERDEEREEAQSADDDDEEEDEEDEEDEDDD